MHIHKCIHVSLDISTYVSESDLDLAKVLHVKWDKHLVPGSVKIL